MTTKPKPKPRAKPRETREAPPGLLDGNGRAARLARWLRDQPTRRDVDTLVLEIRHDDTWSRVQCWQRHEAGIHLATSIDSMVTDLADETGSYIVARVSWLDSSTGDTWTEHALRVQPTTIDTAQAFAGDATSVTIQTQRAAERLAGLYIGGIESAVGMARSSAALVQSHYDAAQAEITILRERVARLETDCSELERQLEDALAVAEEASERPANDNGKEQQFGQILTLLAAQAAKGQS